jgi:F-type H+-transporting ATPase subunit gamma
MKMVSAARLRRAQEQALATRHYTRMMASVLESLARRVDVYDAKTGEGRSPLLAFRPEKSATLVIITGDKGFAGAFNTNIVKAAREFIDSRDDVRIDLDIVGRKGRDMLRHSYPLAPAIAGGREPENRASRVEIAGVHPGILDMLTLDKATDLARILIRRYSDRETDAVYLVYNEFQSVIAQRVVVERVLPIREVQERRIASVFEMEAEERERMGKAAQSAGVSLKAEDTREADVEASKFGTSEVDYIYEQPPEELLAALLPRYISNRIYHALRESVAAEHAARMTAMDAATNNASDMIDSYTLTMNRLRQAAITKEIVEIVSAAAALS